MLDMNNKYKFVKFEGGYHPRGDTKIAINNSGLIRLSSGFCRITKATNFTYAVLFYDATNQAVAFKFTEHLEKGAVKITKDKTAATLATKSFFNANGLNFKSHFGRYDWKKLTISDIGEVYIIELTKK